jgi:hypothetical protein
MLNVIDRRRSAALVMGLAWAEAEMLVPVVGVIGSR